MKWFEKRSKSGQCYTNNLDKSTNMVRACNKNDRKQESKNGTGNGDKRKEKKRKSEKNRGMMK